MSYRKVKTGNVRKQSSGSHASGGNRKKKSYGGGKTVLIVLAAVVLLAFIGSTVMGIIYSPSRSECKEIVEDFQTACNELDTEGILDCLKPSVANSARIALGIGSVVTSQSSDKMLENILGLLGGGLNDITNSNDLSIRSVFETMEIETKKISFPGRTRKVKCKAVMCGIQQDIYISVTKESGESYISSMAFKE